ASPNPAVDVRPSDFAVEWRELSPPARSQHVQVFDERHRRLIVFGGLLTGKPTRTLWVLSVDAPDRGWTKLDPVNDGPTARFNSAGIYDPIGERVLIYGGQVADRLFDDFWELSLRGRPKWRRIETLGSSPGTRTGHTLTLDPEHRRLVLF